MATIDFARPRGSTADVGTLGLLFASPPESRTLEDVISGSWEELSAHRTATCPICAGPMVARYGSGPSAVGGRCHDCETELS
jgi:hypothetical protein